MSLMGKNWARMWKRQNVGACCHSKLKCYRKPAFQMLRCFANSALFSKSDAASGHVRNCSLIETEF